MKKIGKILASLYCFLFGHDWVKYQLDNSDIHGGIWQSAWGVNTCTRCGKEHAWQWDR